jgi:hypothetical protein
MKTRTGSMMYLSFMETLSQNFREFLTASICPCENLGRGSATKIDTDKTVPKCAGRDVRYLAFSFFRSHKHLVDNRDDVFKKSVGLGTDPDLVFSSRQRARNQGPSVIIERGTHARRTDVQAQN